MGSEEKDRFVLPPTTQGFEVIVRMPEEKKEKIEPVYDGANGPTFIVEIKKDWVHSKARMCVKHMNE